MKTLLITTLSTLVFLPPSSTKANSCQKRDYGNGSPVCVCDSEFCDFIKPIKPIGESEAVVYASDKAGRRFERSIIPVRMIEKGVQNQQNRVCPYRMIGNGFGQGICITSPEFYQANVSIDSSKKYQSIEGFGGAFTDAAGINIANLPAAAQEFLLRSYFSPEGIEYNVGRIPLSSTDASTRAYSYDDVKDDFELTRFSLAEEDLKYKIPFIKTAQNYSSRGFKLIGSSWSAPAWMKTSGCMESNGTLFGEPKPNDRYYTTWANYYVKFLQEYAKHGLSFYAITPQNEPSAGWLYNYRWQTQGFTSQMERDFIKYNLGPALHHNGFSNVSIMILDDQRFLLPAWARTILRDPEARKYVSHIAVHYYLDYVTPATALDMTHEEFPEFPIFPTEGSASSQDGFLFGPRKEAVILGSWKRAEIYAHDIIEDLNHWCVGWVDWNMVTDLQGGPNWVQNFADSAIIVNSTSREFYKQPSFYALGHFSKFLPPNSYRIGLEANFISQNVEMTAFMNAQGYKTVVLMNRENVSATLSILDETKGAFVKLSLTAKSIVTILWK